MPGESLEYGFVDDLGIYKLTQVIDEETNKITETTNPILNKFNSVSIEVEFFATDSAGLTSNAIVTDVPTDDDPNNTITRGNIFTLQVNRKFEDPLEEARNQELRGLVGQYGANDPEFNNKLTSLINGGLEDQYDVFKQVIKDPADGGLGLDPGKTLETLEQLDSYGFDVELNKEDKDKLFESLTVVGASLSGLDAEETELIQQNLKGLLESSSNSQESALAVIDLLEKYPASTDNLESIENLISQAPEDSDSYYEMLSSAASNPGITAEKLEYFADVTTSITPENADGFKNTLKNLSSLDLTPEAIQEISSISDQIDDKEIQLLDAEYIKVIVSDIALLKGDNDELLFDAEDISQFIALGASAVSTDREALAIDYNTCN